MYSDVPRLHAPFSLFPNGAPKRELTSGKATYRGRVVLQPLAALGITARLSSSKEERWGERESF
jgi:hypothetical protein